jgi:hypothetical protein
MKELRITPGEWSVFYGTNGTVVLNEDDEMIVSAHNAISGHSEQNANARLIAAAPDLLAALKLIISYHDDGNCELHSEDIAMARAAISKALGEE